MMHVLSALFELLRGLNIVVATLQELGKFSRIYISAILFSAKQQVVGMEVL